jgi:hypothetical protein
MSDSQFVGNLFRQRQHIHPDTASISAEAANFSIILGGRNSEFIPSHSGVDDGLVVAY